MNDPLNAIAAILSLFTYSSIINSFVYFVYVTIVYLERQITYNSSISITIICNIIVYSALLCALWIGQCCFNIFILLGLITLVGDNCFTAGLTII